MTVYTGGLTYVGREGGDCPQVKIAPLPQTLALLPDYYLPSTDLRPISLRPSLRDRWQVCLLNANGFVSGPDPLGEESEE